MVDIFNKPNLPKQTGYDKLGPSLFDVVTLIITAGWVGTRPQELEMQNPVLTQRWRYHLYANCLEQPPILREHGQHVIADAVAKFGYDMEARGFGHFGLN